MNILAQHIKSQPPRPKREWAEDFGISRPHLYDLLDGSRHPSLDVAVRIEAATGGSVPASSWPNLAKIADALNGGPT